MTENEFKTVEASEPPKERKKERKERNMHLTGIFRSIINGEILTKDAVLRLMPFIFYLCFLFILYIANSYNYESNIKEASKLSDQLIELEYEYITTQADLVYIKQQSEIAARLDSLNTGIEESVLPPKIKIFENKKINSNVKP
jgi:hypothetical protein